MTKTSGPSGRFTKVIGHNELGFNYWGNHKLRNSHSALDKKGGVARIVEDNPNFSAVIRIDGAGRIEEADSVFQG